MATESYPVQCKFVARVDSAKNLHIKQFQLIMHLADQSPSARDIHENEKYKGLPRFV